MNMDFSKERIPRKSGEDRGIDPEPAGNDRHRTGITYSQSGGQTESTTIFHDSPRYEDEMSRHSAPG